MIKDDRSPKFGFHPLADLVSPLQVLAEAAAAEEAGFDSIFIPDHFHPWSVAAGTSFAWTLMASIAERSRGRRVGTAVTCPTLRYNPAIVAQAFATLGSVYEGRIFLGLGTGEALNEVPVGCRWPDGRDRLRMLREAVQVIRALWQRGDHVTFKGRYYALDEAKLYTLPKSPVPIYISGLGPEAARTAGEVGDGWITTGLKDEYLRDVLIPAFERGQKKGGRDPSGMERVVEVLISYDEDYDKAMAATRSIAGAFFPAVGKYGVHDPREIDEYGRMLDPVFLRERLLVLDDPEALIARMEDLLKLGFTWLEIANLSPDNSKFLRIAQNRVLPYMREESRRDR